MKKKLIVGNWKMNPVNRTEARELLKGITKVAHKFGNIKTVVCPPSVFIERLSESYNGEDVFFGGQDLFYEEKGAFTGQISPHQLYSVGADYVIIGHSERRELGEHNKDVQKKIRMALNHKLIPIVCIGEPERDSHGKYLAFLRKQITDALKGVRIDELKKVVIAYEPIWAIGKTGRDAITPQKLHETTLFIKRVLLELYSKEVAMKVTILYGGSVKPMNTEELLRDGEVDGFLIGGASLNAESFTAIMEIANNL